MVLSLHVLRIRFYSCSYFKGFFWLDNCEPHGPRDIVCKRSNNGVGILDDKRVKIHHLVAVPRANDSCQVYVDVHQSHGLLFGAAYRPKD